MKKKFIKSGFKEVHKFMDAYDYEFYIEDVLSDDRLDVNMKSMFITNECELTVLEVKKFAIGYAELMPQDHDLSEAIRLCRLYLDDRITLQQLNDTPNKLMQGIVAKGLDFNAIPKLPLMLYNLNNDDQMLSIYVHMICTGCSYHLQYEDEKVIEYFKRFVKEN